MQAERQEASECLGDVLQSPGKLCPSLPDRPGVSRASPLNIHSLEHLWELSGFAQGCVHSWCSINAYHMNGFVHLFISQVF